MGEGQTKALKGMKRNHYKQAYISMLKNLFPISKKSMNNLHVTVSVAEWL